MRPAGAPSVVTGFEQLATPITFRTRRNFAAFWQGKLEKFRGGVQAAGFRPGD